MQRKRIGIEIGGTKFQAIVTDDQINVLDKVVDTVGETKEAIILQDKIKKTISRLTSIHNIESIGIGFGGPVDIKTGKIITSFQVKGWNNFNIKTWLNNLYNIPVFVDNDANTAALAEARLGYGKNYNRVFYITLGSGVGGGFIINGSVYHGKSHCESEFGHIRINKTGETIESSCSGWALNKKLTEYILNEPDGILSKIVQQKRTDPSKCLLEAINKGDVNAYKIFNDLIDNLAYGLSHVVHILNPNIIIFGGGLSLIGEYLTNSIIKKLPQFLMPSLKNELPEIKIAYFKEDVVPLGAVLLATTNFD